MAKADWINLHHRARSPFVMVGTSQAYPIGTVGFVAVLDVLAGAAATTVTVREGGPTGTIIAQTGAPGGARARLRNVLFRNGLHVTVSESDAILMGVGTPDFDASLLVTSVSPATPTPPGDSIELPDGALFTDSITTQDATGGVVFPGSDLEWATFGDQKELDGATKFTKVWDLEWANTPSTNEGWAGRYEPGTNDRQWCIRVNVSGDVEVFLSQNGTDYAALKTATFTMTAARVKIAIAYDGSLGGTNGINRIKLYRDLGAGFSELPFSGGQVFISRTDVPPNLDTPADGTEERMGNTLAGSTDSFNGIVYGYLSVVGQAYNAVELDAMNLDAPSSADWDRFYPLNTDLRDTLGGIHGVFTTT